MLLLCVNKGWHEAAAAEFADATQAVLNPSVPMSY